MIYEAFRVQDKTEQKFLKGTFNKDLALFLAKKTFQENPMHEIVVTREVTMIDIVYSSKNSKDINNFKF